MASFLSCLTCVRFVRNVLNMNNDTAGVPEEIEEELSAIEVEHEDEIDALKEAARWESDYSIDPSGQSGEGW